MGTMDEREKWVQWTRGKSGYNRREGKVCTMDEREKWIQWTRGKSVYIGLEGGTMDERKKVYDV